MSLAQMDFTCPVRGDNPWFKLWIVVMVSLAMFLMMEVTVMLPAGSYALEISYGRRHLLLFEVAVMAAVMVAEVMMAVDLR